MIKVKDNIELKELEKFGFTKKGDEYVYTEKMSLEILAVQKNRNIYIETKATYYGAIVEDLFYKLFELIEEGIVEKVER